MNSAVTTRAAADAARLPLMLGELRLPTMKRRWADLAEADGWIAQGHNLLAFGPPGVGKTHLVAGIGHALIDQGYKVLFVRTSSCSDCRPRAAICACRASWPSSIASTCSCWTI